MAKTEKGKTKAKPKGGAKAKTKKPVGRPPAWTPAKIREEAEALDAWLVESIDSLWLKNFAETRGYPAEYISRWSEDVNADGTHKHPEFHQAVKRAMSIQESRVVTGGLRGDLNPTMCIFVLKNNHGWRDVKGVEHELGETYQRTIKDVLADVDGQTKGLPGEEG